METEGPFPTATATSLSQIHSLHSDQPYFLNIHLNIILSILSLTFRLPYQNSLCLTDHLPHMSYPSLPTGLDHLNNI
jgi:hypothetical protein